MSGVKGRSGRRPMSVEMKRLAIIDKSWDRAGQALDGKKLEPQQFDMAKNIVIKSMPENVTHSGVVATAQVDTSNMSNEDIIRMLNARS